MKRIFRNLIAATMLMAGFATIGVGCTNYDDDIAHLQDQIDDLKGTDIDHVKTLNDLAALTQSLSQQASDIQSQLNAQKSAYDKEISDLKTALQNLQNNTATKAELQALQSQYTSLKGDVDDLKAFKTTIEGRVATLEGKVAELEKKMQAAEQIFQEWADFSELWFGTEENGWKGFYQQLQNAMGHVENWDKAAEFLAEYQFDMENWFGKYDEDGEWQPGLMKFVEEYIMKNGELDFPVLADTIVKLTEQVADLEAILSDLGDDSLADYIKNQVDGILGDTTLADFYDKYEKLQETVFGKDVNWEAQAEWLKSTGNDSYADIIQSIYKDIEELNSLVSAVSEAENKIKTAIENVIEQQLQDGGSINKAIAAATSDIADLLAKIEEIERIQKEQQQAIADLIDRIQSLVYVPEYNDGKIRMGGLVLKYTNEEGEEVNLVLTTSSGVKTVATYRVSPADLAEKLAENADWKFYANTVKRASVTSADVEIEDISYVGDGLIDFVISTTHDFATEDLAIALCVSLPGSNDEVEGDNGDVEEGEDTPETRAEDSTLTVRTEFTSPYTFVSLEAQNVIDRFVFAKQVEETEGDAAVVALDENDENNEAGEGNEEGEGEEEETPAEPVLVWKTYDELATPNTAGTNKYIRTTSRIYQDLEQEYTFFEGFEVVYYDPIEKTYLTLDELAEKWNVKLAWGFTHEADQPKANGTALGDTPKDYEITVEDDDNQPWGTVVRHNGIPAGLKNTNSSYDATDVIRVYLYDSEAEEADKIAFDNVKYNNYYYVVKDELTVTAEAEFDWQYENWNTKTAYEIDVDFGEQLNATQLTELSGKTWTVTLTDEDNFETFGDVSATSTYADDKFTFTLENYAYSHGTSNTMTFKLENKGETTVVTATVTVTVNTPEEREIVLDNTLDYVTSTAVDYLVYTVYAAEDGNAPLEGYNTGAHYTAEEVERFFGDDWDAANRMARIGANGAAKPLTALETEVEGNEADLFVFNTYYAASRGLEGYTYESDEVEAAIKAMKPTAAILAVKFSALDFTEETTIEFTVPEDQALTVTNGPVFPISGKVTVSVPEVDFKQGERLSGTNGIDGIHGHYDGANKVVIFGKHNPEGAQTTHDFVYERADLLSALFVEDKENYWVEFEVVEPEDYDAETNGDLPTLYTAQSGDKYDEALIDWADLTYHNLAPAAKYNTIDVKASLKSRNADADNDITYKTRVITVIAEIPFNDAYQNDHDSVFKVERNKALDVTLNTLLQMENLVTTSMEEDEFIFGGSYIKKRFTNDECYALAIEWGETEAVEVNGEAYELVYTCENGIFHIDANDAGIAHEYTVTAHYKMTGNFGYEYEGTVTFTVK